MEHTLSIKTRLLIAILKALRFPVVPQNPKIGKWYRIPLPDCVAGDGKEYHGSFRIGTENKLMVMFHGGGVSWNAYMAARPNSLYTQPDTINFYGTDSDPIADLATGHGISSNKKSNPFRDWSIISVPYSSGDFHCGTNDFPYLSVDGTPSILYHHGYTNYRAVMAQAMQYIDPSPEQSWLLVFLPAALARLCSPTMLCAYFPSAKTQFVM